MIGYIFWISLFFIFYTYLLYPVIIICWSRVKKRQTNPKKDTDALPSVTMIIIVYNEEKRILSKLENCRALDYPRAQLNICVVSDGSTDRTNEILRDQHDILFIEDGVNHGKPYQINKVIELCESEIIAFSDVRQMYEADALIKLVENFTDSRIGAVSGELAFRPSHHHTGRSIGLYWKYEKLLRKAESNVDSTLGVTGAIYAIRRELLAPIPTDTILDDVEIPLQTFRKGYRVIFEPEAVAYDTASSEIRAEFKRKVRTLTGNFQLFRRNQWLLNPFKNKIFLQVVSHKFFRLLIPYALLALFLMSTMLSNSLYKTFFWIQVILYSAGIAALLFGFLRKNSIMNFISVFLSLNAASVIALYKFTFNKTDARWNK